MKDPLEEYDKDEVVLCFLHRRYQPVSLGSFSASMSVTLQKQDVVSNTDQ